MVDYLCEKSYYIYIYVARMFHMFHDHMFFAGKIEIFINKFGMRKRRKNLVRD